MTNNSPLPTNTGGVPEDEYEPGTHTKAFDSKITTPEQDAQQEEKLKKLDSYFDQKIQAHLTVLTANLQEHASKIDMILEAIQGAQQQQPQQQPQQPKQEQNMPSLSSLPPELQGQLLTGIAQIIQAWKGGGDAAPKEDYFSQMSKNITLNMLQAGVDGIMRNVYDNYNPVPPGRSIIPKPGTEHKLQ